MRKPASAIASSASTTAPVMVSNDFPPPSLACGSTGPVDGVSAGVGLAMAAAGVRSGLITGNRLEMFPAGAVEVRTAPVGAGAVAGSPPRSGITARTVAWGDVPGSGEGEGGVLVGVCVGSGVLLAAAVTVVVPVACAVIDGFVAATAAAVSETRVVPLDGVPIWARRVNDDGVTSVPSGPSWHEAAPSPLGHKPVNTAWPADAVRVTDTSGAAPFWTWTWTTNPASLPACTLDWDGFTTTHRSAGGLVDDTDADGEGDGVTAGNGRHCEPPLEAAAAGV